VTARILCAVLVLAACRTPIDPVKTYDREMDAGSRAEALGDLPGAEEAYRRAHANAELGHLSDEQALASLRALARVLRRRGQADEAAVTVARAEALCDTAHRDAYQCGLVKRDVCKLEEAEALLREAIEIQTRTRTGTRAELSGRQCELAHLRFERGRFEDARPSFERCIELLQEFDAEHAYPEEYLYLLGEYAQVLRATGRRPAAEAIDARAAAIRARGITPKSAWQHPRCPA